KPARAACERISLNADPLQHRDEQVAQGSIVVALEGDMLPMPESAASKQNRQIRIVVDVRIAHVASVQHHGLIQEPTPILLPARKILHDLPEERHLLPVDLL